jgi:hypothetical protein
MRSTITTGALFESKPARKLHFAAVMSEDVMRKGGKSSSFIGD